MTALNLRSDLSYCIIRGRTIFLDLPHNRYFALSPKLDAVFQRISSGCASSEIDIAGAARLCDLNILVIGDCRAPFVQADVPRARSSLFDEAVSDGKWISGSILAAKQLGIRLRLRVQPLQRIINTCRHRAKARSLGVDRPLDIARDVIRHARQAEKLLSTHNQCLSRSLTQFEAMGARGFWPSLVFGIADVGFAAHCWLQYGEIVLNDTLDLVRLYTPILVI